MAIGFSIAAPVGPIGVLCIRRTLSDGRLHGLVSGFGAATADAIYGSIAAFGLTLVSTTLVSHADLLRLIGGLFLGYLGLKALLSSPATEAARNVTPGRGLLGAYLSTFLLTLANPLTVFAFLGVFAGLGAAQTAPAYASAGTMVVGVFAGSALWWFVLSGGVNLLRTRFKARALLWVNRISGLVILAFAGHMLLSLALP